MVGWGDDGRFHRVQLVTRRLNMLTTFILPSSTPMGGIRYSGREQFDILEIVPGIQYYFVDMVLCYANKY